MTVNTMPSRLTIKGLSPIFKNQLQQLYELRDELIENDLPVDNINESIESLSRYIENIEMENDDE